MSTSPDENTIQALSESQVMALGGWGDVLTWMRWLREHREFVKPILAAFEEFSNATSWAARLAALGRLIDAMAAVIVTVPTAVSATISAILAPESGDDPDEQADWIAAELNIAKNEFEASAIPWGSLITKLPQLVAFLQLVAEMIKRFRAPEGVAAASVAISSIHGLVYRPFANAA